MSQTRYITVPVELLEAALASLELVNPDASSQADPEGQIQEATDRIKSTLSGPVFGASLPGSL
jgi:hypothetical protein